MVRLSDLKVYDVFSYGVAEVRFEPKLVLVDGRNYDEDVGSNQVGKSSLFDALTTALFEENTRGQIKDDVVNRLKKRGRIEVGVSGGEVVYQRGGENRWYVRVGDKRVELSWNSMRAWIRDNLLGGMSYKEFLLSSWFYQGALNEFVKASDMERKELFIKWFQLDVFLKAREIIKEEIKSVENEIHSVKSKIDEIKRLTSEVVEVDASELERALSVLERFKNGVYPVSVYRERRREVLSALDSIRKAELVKDIVVKLEDELKEIEVRLSQLRLRLKYIGED
ncbi:MAG: AAA family ATPase, partial [Candidatus Bathyarchaeia archaeon]